MTIPRNSSAGIGQGAQPNDNRRRRGEMIKFWDVLARRNDNRRASVGTARITQATPGLRFRWPGAAQCACGG
jgi:hypothetical protein